ncbi:LysE family translocator [Glutamicibacter sp. NPDC090743]|uniref:LysE family translocator n=1 Tax=Glutamicibacter sp. NPDC090743 TaxID=3364001 RepID=UPI0038163A1C
MHTSSIWSSYLSFLALAFVLVLIPGPDFAVVSRNTLSGGRRRGTWSAVGVASSTILYGFIAAIGLGALIMSVRPVFEVIRWAGIAYLTYLGFQAFRSAWKRDYASLELGIESAGPGASRGWLQGFLSNVGNPKILVFYLAVLPQFLNENAPMPVVLGFAFTHALLSLVYLVLLVCGIHQARSVLSRPRVRRLLDLATGTALIGFGIKLVLK